MISGDRFRWARRMMAAALGLLLPAAGQDVPEEAAGNRLSQKIEVSPGVSLSFDAEFVEPGARRELARTGYVEYKGKIYRAIADPPRMILKSGAIVIDGTKVELDVSGLADCWAGNGKIHPRFTRFVRFDEHPGYYELSVCFAKGGADDFVVEWVIREGKQMRVSIRNVGDEYPDWVSEE